MFKKLSQQLIYQDDWLELFQDQIEFPNGTTGAYAWVRRKNGVGVIVLTPDKRILLHKEHRYVINKDSWEIAGGGIDAGETPVQAAVRELQEEVGIRVTPEQLHKLGVFYPLHSFNTEEITLFMVVTPAELVTSQGSETSEEISEPQYVTFEQALSMIDNGQINDAFTAHAIQMAMRKYQSL